MRYEGRTEVQDGEAEGVNETATEHAAFSGWGRASECSADVAKRTVRAADSYKQL
jgi:hypothetical protein